MLNNVYRVIVYTTLRTSIQFYKPTDDTFPCGCAIYTTDSSPTLAKVIFPQNTHTHTAKHIFQLPQTIILFHQFTPCSAEPQTPQTQNIRPSSSSSTGRMEQTPSSTTPKTPLQLHAQTHTQHICGAHCWINI